MKKKTKKQKKTKKKTKRIFRTLVYLLVSYLAYAMYYELAIVEAVTGSMCTTLTSFIAPCTFYYLLFKKDTSMTFFKKISLFFIILLAILAGIEMTFQDIKALIIGYATQTS